MKVIQPTTSQLDGLLRPQQFQKDTVYRLMTYVVRQSVAEGELLYNTLTRCMVLCQPEELQDIKEDSQLIKLWFLVPLTHNDKRLCQQIKSLFFLIQKPAVHINHYTILTTTDCNARCFYCFEKGCQHINMEEETAVKAAGYMIRHAENHKIHLHWFGGEPLFNSKVIDIISRTLQEAGIEYSSKMTSNGYLFDDNIVQRAKTLWKLENVQITLDGTEKVYNHIKRYIYKEGSGYQRVMSNIEKLLEAGIEVVIRLNIDNINIEDMTNLVKEMHQRFVKYHNLSIYSMCLYENSKGGGSRKRTEEQRSQLFKDKMNLEYLIKHYNLHSKKTKLPKKIKEKCCKADSANSLNILPSGLLTKCNRYLDDYYVGNINSDDFDKEVIQLFKERREEIEACNTCAFYPDCIRLKKCEESVVCYPENRAFRIYKIQQAMLNTYQEFFE